MSKPQRHYFRDKVGWRWGVFYTDDDFSTQALALDNLFLDKHTAFCVALEMQCAYRVGVRAGAENPELAASVE